MIGLSVKIQSKADGEQKKNGLDYDQSKAIKIAHIPQACVMEGGMVSGGSSVAFKVVDNDGNQFFAELSANLLRALVRAIDGAEARWDDDKKES